MGFDRWRYVFPLRLRSLFQRNTVERELDHELQYHLDRQIDLNLERGMAAAEARRAALRAMGSIELHKDDCRDQRRVGIADNAMRDTAVWIAAPAPKSDLRGRGDPVARAGHRRERRHLSAVRHHPVAVPADCQCSGPRGSPSRRPASVRRLRRPQREDHVSPLGADSTAISRRSPECSRGEIPGSSVGHGVDARGVSGLWVSGDFFPVLGIAPIRGRLLGPDDDRRGCGSGSGGGEPRILADGARRPRLGDRKHADHSRSAVHRRRRHAPVVYGPGSRGDVRHCAAGCAAALWDARLDQRDRWWLTVMGRLSRIGPSPARTNICGR